MREALSFPFLIATPGPGGRDKHARLSHITKEAIVTFGCIVTLERGEFLRCPLPNIDPKSHTVIWMHPKDYINSILVATNTSCGKLGCLLVYETALGWDIISVS